MIDNLEQIKQAIDVERKYQYINIMGKKFSFAKFIKNELKKIYKKSNNNPKWKILMQAFELYEHDSMSARKKTIERFVKVINEDLNPPKPKIKNGKEVKLPQDTDVIYIKGVGPKIGNALNKLGIYTALDLLFYFPRKHIDYSKRTLIKNLKEGENTTIFGYIKSVSAFVSKKGLSILKVKISDDTDFIELGFFYAKANRVMLERYKSQFPKGAGIMVSGTVKINSFDGKLTFDKPQYSIMTGDFTEGETNSLNLGRIVPIYPLSENVNIKTLRRAIFNALEMYKNEIETVLPQYIVEKYNLLQKKDAVLQMHFPQSMELLEQARFSLIFEELFLIQLKLALLREENRKQNRSIPLKIKPKGLVKQFISSLPFELTKGQKDAINDILNDMNSSEGMQRLLQGDVGSGKTVVATIMLLAAVENGYQGAIMAPTEILAQQHFNNLQQWLLPMGLSIKRYLYN